MLLKKVIFLGSKPIGYHCLTHLIKKQDELGVDIVGVMTKTRNEFGGSNDLGALATSNGIEVFNKLDDLPECDIIYSVQHHEILKKEHISKAKQCAVNLHMAPLPEYRGANQFSFAILEGKKEFGTTIHLIDERIDHGDILFQKRFPIPQDCWVDYLYHLTYKASQKLFEQTLSHIISGNYKPVDQKTLEHKYSTSLHFRNEMNDIKKIDLNWDAEKIERHIRATSMPGFEPPYCMIGDVKVFMTGAPGAQKD